MIGAAGNLHDPSGLGGNQRAGRAIHLMLLFPWRTGLEKVKVMPADPLARKGQDRGLTIVRGRFPQTVSMSR